jgi:signal transduction histidine kinase/CheY-like chemotaxis protein
MDCVGRLTARSPAASSGGAARRLATLDRVLLLTLVPLWTAVFALHVRQVALTGLAEPPVYAWASRDPDGYPVVGAYRPQLHGRETGLAIGDRLLRVGRVDLRGASYLRFYAATLAETDAALEVPLTFERGGQRHTLTMAMRRPAIAWYWIPALLGTAITAVLVLVRAPDVAQARLFFAAVMTFIIFCTPFHGQSYVQSYVSRGVFWYGLGGVGFGLVWLWVICFPGEVPRRERISPAWALLASGVWYVSRINYVTPGLPAAIVPAFKGTCDALLMGGGLAIATRNYRLAGPIGRRRVKWLLYGAYIAIVPLILARALTFLDPEWFYLVTVIGMAGFPLGTLVAIVRYDLFDIDRLISATASHSLVLVEKASSELLRFHDAEIIRRGQAHVEALRVEKEEAHRSNVAKARFLAAASHDLRQPLHALGLLAGTLGDRVHDPEARDLVAQIQRSTRVLEETFDALLDISRLDAGALEVTLSDVRLDPLLARLAHDFQAEASRKGVRLRVVGSRLSVRTDPVLLWRILQNLVSNAVRYTDRGGILVGCRRHGDRVRIDVLDTGRGIPPEQRRVIFEEFRRCEDDPRRAHEGLGLGLSIVERLARLLGHEIDVDSTVGRGSRFGVVAARVQAAGGAAQPRDARPGIDLSGTSVLIVEDDAAARAATRQQLEQWGCEVRAAASAAQACDGLASPPPHVIVATDRLADGASGLDAIAAIRAVLGTPVPALLMTGAASADVLAVSRAGGLPLLHKPVAPAKLRALLSQLVRRHAPRA